jgi:hypothetical protein
MLREVTKTESVFIYGYAAASDLTGLPIETLRGLVSRRLISVRRVTEKSVPIFVRQQLVDQIRALPERKGIS